VLRGAPRSAPALRLLAQTQVRRNEPQAAMETLTQLIDVEPNDLAAREQLAALQVRRGDPAKAIDLYNAVLARAPNRPQSLLAKAETLIALKRWDEADRTIQTILATPEQRAAGHLLSGRRYQASGTTDAAVRAFKEAAALRPGAIEPVTGIVQTYLAAERPNEALAYLNEALAAKSGDAFLLNLKGEVLARQKRIDDAVAVFRDAIAARPEWEIPYANLGNLLVSAGRGAEGIAAFRQGLEKLPDNGRLLYGLGAAEERAGEYGAAIATYEQILAAQPGSDVAANNFAALVADFAYQDTAKLARAMELARRFETSDNPLFLDTLGWVFYRKGDFAQARIYLDRAVQGRGDIPVVQYHLGMTRYRLGDRPGARQALERAVSGDAVYPGKDEAKKTLAALSES
jgi:tetratricopeptide (TPR) repeat protein